MPDPCFGRVEPADFGLGPKDLGIEEDEESQVAFRVRLSLTPHVGLELLDRGGALALEDGRHVDVASGYGQEDLDRQLVPGRTFGDDGLSEPGFELGPAGGGDTVGMTVIGAGAGGLFGALRFGGGRSVVVRDRRQRLDQSVFSEGVFKLALVGTDLFWSQGAFTPAPQLSYYDTTGWLSTEADPTPRKVIDNAFELGFDGTWMVWVHDDCENGYCNRIYAMRTDQASPLVLTPMPQLGSPDLPFRSIWPSVGEGLAAWSIDGPQGSPLVVWPTGASTPVAVAGTSTIAGTSIEDGWLVWNEGEGFGAAKVTDVLSAIASAGIH